MDSLADGISSTAGRVADAARNAASSAWNAAKNFLGISSPSRLFTKMGEDTGEGYIVGIRKKARDIYSAFDDVFSGIGYYGGLPNIGSNPLAYATRPSDFASPQVSGGGTTQYITLNVKFEDIDQVSKLVELFDGFTHDETVFGGAY
jgi:phage-related protein